LKELAKILLPGSNAFDFEKLKREVQRFKLEDLTSQLKIKKDGLENLNNALKSKLDEDTQE
jgi:hypothetical protein